MFASIRDTKLYFDVEGAGLIIEGSRLRERSTAFFIHGGPGSDHAAGRAAYISLKDRLQLVFFDQRGQGRSERGNVLRYTLDENVEDLEALRCHLGLGKIISIGTSYGGLVAMAHAARYPEAVSHLILIVTAAHGGFIERAKSIVAERGSSGQQEWFETLLAGRIDTPEKLRTYYEVMGTLYSHRYDPEQARVGLDRTMLSVEAINAALGPEGFLHDVDLRPELASITAPTLIIAGRYDWICAPEFAEEIHALISGSELRIFEGSAHTVASDENEALRDVILGFLPYRMREPC